MPTGAISPNASSSLFHSFDDVTDENSVKSKPDQDGEPRYPAHECRRPKHLNDYFFVTLDDYMHESCLLSLHA